MMKIMYAKAELIEEDRTVRFLSSFDGNEIIVEMSILQLAKIWGNDKNLFEYLVFGDEDLEDKCMETKKKLLEFPSVKVRNNKLLFQDFSLTKRKEKFLLFVEDINGWGNEGIRIYVPINFYDNFLKNKNIYIQVNSKFIDFIEK
jgi:hypothetical protein